MRERSSSPRGRTWLGIGCLLLFGGAGAVDGQCELQELLASDAGAYDQFGYSVARSGDLALIGAIQDDDNGQQSGSAYVFRDTGGSWIQEQKLLASDGTPQDWFGCAVALSGDLALVGARYDEDNGTE